MVEMERSVLDNDVSESPYCVDRVEPFLVNVGESTCFHILNF